MDAMGTWSIGELADAAGVTPRSLRHYEAEGLLTPTDRTAAGHRRYGPDVAAQLYRIVALRSLGLSIDEVRAVMTDEDPVEALRATAARHLASVERGIDAAVALRERLALLARPTPPQASDPTVTTNLALEAIAMTVALDRISTRTGDDGTTAVAGRRVPKDDARVEALGMVDDLNARVGIAACDPGAPEAHRALLVEAQQRLFDLGADLATRHDGPSRIFASDVAALDQTVADLSAAQPPLRSFILPGGGPYAAALHACRTGCRTAERRVVTLARADADAVAPDVLRYLNRLSDLFFVLSRDAAYSDVLWEPRPSPASISEAAAEAAADEGTDEAAPGE